MLFQESYLDVPSKSNVSQRFTTSFFIAMSLYHIMIFRITAPLPYMCKVINMNYRIIKLDPMFGMDKMHISLENIHLP